MSVMTALSLVLVAGFVATGLVGFLGWRKRMRGAADVSVRSNPDALKAERERLRLARDLSVRFRKEHVCDYRVDHPRLPRSSSWRSSRSATSLSASTR